MLVIGKYKYTDKEIKQLLDSIVLITDTREQDTYIMDWFKKKKKSVVKKKLDFGDYSFYLPKNEGLGILKDTWFNDEIVIERKNSLEEIIGNMTTDNGSRLEKELALCPAKMTVVIEDQYDRACLGTYNSKYNRKSLLGKLAAYEHRYNVPIRFLRKESVPVFIYTYFYYYLREKLK